MSFDWKKTLGTVAPALATALGGPLAGMAVGMATKALGIDQSEDALAEAVASGNPEIMVKLKQVNADFTVEMKRLDVDLEKIASTDRSSARDMATKTTLKPQIILSTLFVIGFIAVLYGVFGGGVTVTVPMKDAAMYLLGILSTGIMQIMNFFFGSSSGSQIKTQLMGLQGKQP